MKKIMIGCLACLAVLGGIFSIEDVWATEQDNPCEQGVFNADCIFPTWQSEANPGQAEDAVVQGVIGANQDAGFIMSYIPRMIDILLKFIAPIVVLMMIYAGVRFITAQGDDDALGKAKDFFTFAIIGVAIVIFSYSIMKIVYFLVAKG